MKMCSIDGCKRQSHALGLCQCHYKRLQAKGTTASLPGCRDYHSSELDRFLSFVRKMPSGCWVWKGHKGKSGYGTFSHNNYPMRAHRYSYQAHGGVLIDGLQIDHKCRNRACVNPAHLEQVTGKENVRRTSCDIRSIPRDAPLDRCTKGHLYADFGGAYIWHDGVLRCRECIRLHGKEYFQRVGKARRNAYRLIVTPQQATLPGMAA